MCIFILPDKEVPRSILNTAAKDISSSQEQQQQPQPQQQQGDMVKTPQLTSYLNSGKFSFTYCRHDYVSFVLR